VKKFLTTTAIVAAILFTGSVAGADEEAARNHGYDTAALEVGCAGMVSVTNPRLRAKLDKQYRENPRWRQAFLEGYRAAAERPTRRRAVTLLVLCMTAENSGWLKLDPAARDQLTIKDQIERER
jgi:hypothetical protein